MLRYQQLIHGLLTIKTGCVDGEMADLGDLEGDYVIMGEEVRNVSATQI